MNAITRDKNGNHFLDGRPFFPRALAKPYRKVALAHAIQMTTDFSVETLEGTMKGKSGDWLMIGVNDELYPCDAEIFEKSYEPVEDNTDANS